MSINAKLSNLRNKAEIYFYEFSSILEKEDAEKVSIKMFRSFIKK